ncbi:VanZ family protein [Nocardiopsis metallicus]|uniref:VanZ-like domain-containing protein n=1 Tax=Nocardiopsis metallicus TaxID=179819 RepID=A0A840WE42_9ACTN|nr:VanZ family protein [Nocardiopsis metallicus]MBB5495249.1 hypothetical protein [Nocardiopsis metallicus]
MWQVLFHVNPTTITAALGLCLLAALAFAWWRRPDPQRSQGAMRKLLAVAGAVYLAVLLAPIGGFGSIHDSDRKVVWDPMLSFQDIPGIGRTSGLEREFGQQLEDGRSVHYAPEGVPAEERSGDDLYVQDGPDGPDGTLMVTDAEGDAPPQEDTAVATRVIEENFERQTDYAAQLEAEGPWGTTGGLALQERVLNTLLFVPIGVVAFFAFSSWVARLLFGPALSLTVEASQWALPWGRIANIGDLMVNSAGSLIGTLIAALSVGVVTAIRSAPVTGEAPTGEAGEAGEEPLSPTRG